MKERSRSRPPGQSWKAKVTAFWFPFVIGITRNVFPQAQHKNVLRLCLPNLGFLVSGFHYAWGCVSEMKTAVICQPRDIDFIWAWMFKEVGWCWELFGLHTVVMEDFESLGLTSLQSNNCGCQRPKIAGPWGFVTLSMNSQSKPPEEVSKLHSSNAYMGLDN